jgi:hypothetical protein
MQRVTLKISVSLIAFTIGIVCAAVWFVHPLSLNQSSEGLPQNTVLVEETEEYAVYSAVINERYVKGDSAKLLVILNQTSFYGNQRERAIYGDDYVKRTTSEQRIRQMKESYPSVSEEILSDYDAKRMKSNKVGHNFNLLVEYKLINGDELENNKRLDRTIRLSKVGFNSEKTQAFVYVEFICFALCGEGNQLLLEKADGVWKIKQNFGGWRS